MNDAAANRRPTVSVVLPTYERPALLAGALESALAQELGDLEIVIGDDSGDDETEQLVASYDDPRIRYHRNCPGLGAQRNWLDLIGRARAELVATLHDDDLWDAAYLATMVPPMIDDPATAMTFNDFWIMDVDGNRLEQFTEHEAVRTHRSELPAGPLQLDRELGLRLVAVWNAPQPAYAAVLRRDAVLACDFPDEIDPLYDIWLSYQLIRDGHRVRYEPARLSNYRIHAASATSAGFGRAEDAVFDRIVAECGDLPGVVEEIRRYWGGLRWARATRLMADPADQAASRRELAAAAPDLDRPRRLVAQLGARSAVAWSGLRLLKSLRHDDHGAVIG